MMNIVIQKIQLMKSLTHLNPSKPTRYKQTAIKITLFQSNSKNQVIKTLTHQKS